jgi:hypothetical protein
MALLESRPFFFMIMIMSGRDARGPKRACPLLVHFDLARDCSRTALATSAIDCTAEDQAAMYGT